MMKITVINGTEKRGITFQLKEIFLEQFIEYAEIKEFYLPKDCPSFCIGCTNCILKGENKCKDNVQIQKIASSLLEADLIVMTSPAYVMHTTGAMKALLDHFAYLWMPHRPASEMFSKRAVIITQCLGAGAKSTAKDIKHSLSWWGISKIKVSANKILNDIVWDKLTEKKRYELTKKMKKLSKSFLSIDYKKPSKINLIIRAKFLFCRMIIKTSLYKNFPESPDNKYWAEQGWLGKNRPWRR